jgi:hypothetical protein
VIDSQGQGSTSGAGKFGGTEVAALSSDYCCVALLARPGKISVTDSLQENFLVDFINMTKTRRKGKGLGIPERVNLVAWNVR